MVAAPSILEDVLPHLKARWNIPAVALRECHMGNGVVITILVTPVCRRGESEPHLLIAVSGQGKDTVNRYMEGLQSLIGASRMEIPGVRRQPIPHGCLIAAPWVFRGELRAGAMAALLPAGEAVRRFVGDGPDSWLPGSGGKPQDLAGLRRALYRFVYPAGHESLLRMFSRLRVYRLPFGCAIRETTRVNVKDWRLTFADFDNLERAHMLYAAFMSRRPLRHLIALDPVSDVTADDALLSEMKFIALRDYPKARRELAMVIWHIASRIQRFSFETTAAALDPQPQWGT